MRSIIVLLCLLIASAFGNPLFLYGIEPSVVDATAGAPIETDSTVTDAPEMTTAKVQNEAKQRVKLSDDAAKMADPISDATTIATTIVPKENLKTVAGPTSLVPIVPEVAKAAVQIGEKIKQDQESLRSAVQPPMIIVPAIFSPHVPYSSQIFYPTFF